MTHLVMEGAEAAGVMAAVNGVNSMGRPPVGSGINYSYVFKFEEEFDHVEVRGKVEEVS